jgi:hypothetical protein
MIVNEEFADAFGLFSRNTLRYYNMNTKERQGKFVEDEQYGDTFEFSTCSLTFV